MAETLLSASGVLLYGRVLEDLEFTPKKPSDTFPEANSDDPPPRLGDNKFLQKQLEAHPPDQQGNLDERRARIARIYSFSYEGHYYDMARPALFLVHGPGVRAEGQLPGAAKVSRAPAPEDRLGVAATGTSFAEEMRVWAYDKGDFSIRLDVETGTFEDILLETELSQERVKITFAGKNVRLRGDRGGGMGD